MAARELLRIEDVRITYIYEGETRPLSEGVLQILVIGDDSDMGLLVLHSLDDEFQLIVERTTPIYLKPPTGYYIPNVDKPGEIYNLDMPSAPDTDRSTFETLLAEYAALMDRSMRNTVALIDLDDGSVVGTMDADVESVREDDTVSEQGREKDAVVLDLEQTDEAGEPVVRVTNAEKSHIERAGEYVAGGIVLSANKLGASLRSAADAYLERKQRSPSARPLIFKDSTKAGARRIYKLSTNVVKVSDRTLGAANRAAESAGRAFGKVFLSTKSPETGESVPATTGLRGKVNQSLLAVSSVYSGFADSARSLTADFTAALETATRAHYGDDAAEISADVSRAVRNVVLVYYDSMGVQRRALIKAAGRGVVRGRTTKGDEVIIT